ncbi:MAG: GldG family protein [Methylococcaceae bacterium]|nr:GldG family protein [Methylococcaceae bacterium]
MTLPTTKRAQHPRLKHRCITAVLLLLMGVVAWLSTQYPVLIDITANNRNTLSTPSIQLLQRLSAPVNITAYIKRGLPLRNQLSDLIERYSRIKPDVTVKFVDPAEQPEQIRALDIGAEGAILVEYQGRSEKITFVNETSLSNTLLQLLSTEKHWISFLTGHGERSPIGTANFDLGDFGKRLKQLGYTAQPLNLSSLPAIPDNSSFLVIAGPSVPLLAGELDIIKHYLQQGGNLLLLTEPDATLLKPLLDDLGVQVLPGTLVDNKSKLFGINNATFVLLNGYETPHAITKNLETMTLFPTSAALSTTASPYTPVKLLNSSAEAWNETGELNALINFDVAKSEQMGPLTLGLALTRKFAGKQQRIVVMGDGDFLSNAYIHNVGNLDLGLRLIKWLSFDDNIIDVPARMAPDNRLQLTPLSIAVIGFGFLMILPLILAISGWWIWRQRKKR